MREYRPQRSTVLFFGALTLLCLGLSAFVLAGLFRMQHGADLQVELWLFVPVLLLFVGGGSVFGWKLVSNFASYRVDPGAITRILLGRQEQFPWQDIVEFQSGRMGQYGTAWTLTDTAGRKLKIPVGLLERGYGLEGFLYANLAPLREQKRVQLPQTAQVYRYGKAAGIAMSVIGLFFVCFVVGAFAGSIAQPGPGWSVILPLSVLVFGGFGLLALGTAAYYFTYTIRITPDSITESSLFSTKPLAFHRVAAFYTGEIPMKNGQMQRVTTLVGKDGKKITINPYIIDYDTLTATLRSLVAAPAQQQGQHEKAVASSSSRRQQARIMMVVGPLIALVTLGMATASGRDASIRMERQNQLDHDGRSTRGVVTGSWSQREGKSGTGYYLDFEFQVAGKTYKRTSPVSWKDYNGIANGSPTGVIYMPSDPTQSRMTASIGRRRAIADLAEIGFYVLLAIPTGIYMFFQGWKTLRAEERAGGLTQ